jgi:hypothetical protein
MLCRNFDCLSCPDGLRKRQSNISIQRHHNHDCMVSAEHETGRLFVLMYDSTDNYNNATYSVCNTAFIFESFGDPNPKTDIVCGDKSQIWSFYRQVPASVTESREYLPDI